MTAFIAFWPDSTISVLSYPSGHEDDVYEAWLFDDLDQESDPCDAKVYRLPPGYHIQTDVYIGRHKETGKEKGVLSVTSVHSDGKRPRRLSWSPDAAFKRINRMRIEHRRKQAEKPASEALAIYESTQSQYPPIPDPAFTIDEVRSMESFSGVYIAINESTGGIQYVGKSRDVTRRVSKARPELDGCRLALIKMPESDIHFAELHYIAKYRPTHNREGKATDGR